MAGGNAPSHWAARGATARLLLPLAALYGGVAALRRRLYRWRWLAVAHAARPVIVVGNIAAGGSGKTPVVIWLAERLRAAGHTPGIVSRGYGRRDSAVCIVEPGMDADAVGDEPALIAHATGCPMVVGADRPAAVDRLLAMRPDCSVVISDDGMQHYRMARSVEIAVVDEAVLGNRWLLPAGPLREPVARLREVDLVIFNGPASDAMRAAVAPVPAFPMKLEPAQARRLDAAAAQSLATWRGRRVHAVAGIGRPRRFFEMLGAHGIEAVVHPFPDHHRFTAGELEFSESLPILMTSKDAVKCRSFAPADSWEVPVDAVIDDAALNTLLEKLADGQSSA
ncbi:MAG: tetraacyldisaccharide 4'-kinase [Rhodocyclaceae bacterium]|nr:tetraacyldisaccharide 4'-kinase [Rhodocyclaceae bacterium]